MKTHCRALPRRLSGCALETGARHLVSVDQRAASIAVLTGGASHRWPRSALAAGLTAGLAIIAGRGRHFAAGLTARVAHGWRPGSRARALERAPGTTMPLRQRGPAGGPPMTIGALGNMNLMQQAQALANSGAMAPDALSGPPTLGSLGGPQTLGSLGDLGASGSTDGPPTLGQLATMEGPPTMSALGGPLSVGLPPSTVPTTPRAKLAAAVSASRAASSAAARAAAQRRSRSGSAPPASPLIKHQHMEMLRPLPPSALMLAQAAGSVRPPMPANSPSPKLRAAGRTDASAHPLPTSVPVPAATPSQRPAHPTLPSARPPAPNSSTCEVAVPVQAQVMSSVPAALATTGGPLVVVPVGTRPASTAPVAAAAAAAAATAAAQAAISPWPPAAIAPPLKAPPSKRKKRASNRKPGEPARRKPGRPQVVGDANRKPDGQVVDAVRAMMKSKKISQVAVGKEARVSQAVVSQWLSSKYNGDNGKVDAMMRGWLKAREAGPVGSNPSAPHIRINSKRKGVDGDGDGPKKKPAVGPAAAGVENNASRRAAEDRFNEMLEKLKAYKLKHGHCRVPKKVDGEDKSLGRWVNNIRSGNTKTEAHGRCGCGTDVTNAEANAAAIEDAASEALGHARLNELGFCWHAKNSYKHAERSRLYDMNDTSRLLRSDTIRAIALAMGKDAGWIKIKQDLEEGIKERVSSGLPTNQHGSVAVEQQQVLPLPSQPPPTRNHEIRAAAEQRPPQGMPAPVSHAAPTARLDLQPMQAQPVQSQPVAAPVARLQTHHSDTDTPPLPPTPRLEDRAANGFSYQPPVGKPPTDTPVAAAAAPPMTTAPAAPITAPAQPQLRGPTQGVVPASSPPLVPVATAGGGGIGRDREEHRNPLHQPRMQQQHHRHQHQPMQHQHQHQHRPPTAGAQHRPPQRPPQHQHQPPHPPQHGQHMAGRPPPLPPPQTSALPRQTCGGAVDARARLPPSMQAHGGLTQAQAAASHVVVGPPSVPPPLAVQEQQIMAARMTSSTDAPDLPLPLVRSGSRDSHNIVQALSLEPKIVQSTTGHTM